MQWSPMQWSPMQLVPGHPFHYSTHSLYLSTTEGHGTVPRHSNGNRKTLNCVHFLLSYKNGCITLCIVSSLISCSAIYFMHKNEHSQASKHIYVRNLLYMYISHADGKNDKSVRANQNELTNQTGDSVFVKQQTGYSLPYGNTVYTYIAYQPCQFLSKVHTNLWAVHPQVSFFDISTQSLHYS